jgi:hypothetical protein
VGFVPPDLTSAERGTSEDVRAVDTKAAPHESSTNLSWTGTGLEFTLPSAPLDRRACAQSGSEKKSVEIGQIPFLENRISLPAQQSTGTTPSSHFFI